MRKLAVRFHPTLYCSLAFGDETCFQKAQILVQDNIVMNKLIVSIVLLATVASVAIGTCFLMSKKKKNQSLLLTDPKIIVKKSARRLELYSSGSLVRTYKIALGSNPDEDKSAEGDGCTPTGEFYIFTKNDKSKFYLSLGLSYPNIEDAQRGLRDRLITQEEHDAIIKAINERKMPPQNTALGGEIYIHGGPNGATTDWTAGCIALNNKEIKELFDAVTIHTPVVIEP